MASLRRTVRCWAITAGPRVEIDYSIFEAELGEVAAAGLQWSVRERVEGETVWSREDEGGFPDMPELKRRVRDRAAPSRRLGHSER